MPGGGGTDGPVTAGNETIRRCTVTAHLPGRTHHSTVRRPHPRVQRPRGSSRSARLDHLTARTTSPGGPYQRLLAATRTIREPTGHRAAVGARLHPAQEADRAATATGVLPGRASRPRRRASAGGGAASTGPRFTSGRRPGTVDAGLWTPHREDSPERDRSIGSTHPAEPSHLGAWMSADERSRVPAKGCPHPPPRHGGRAQWPLSAVRMVS